MTDRRTACTNRSLTYLVAVVVASAVVLLGAACSGDDPGGKADGSVESPDTTDGSSETAGSAPEHTPVTSPGCDAGAAEPTGEPTVEAERTITVDGVSRRYLITIPESDDPGEALPVVFDFHGLMEGADIHSKMTGYSDLAQQEGFVVVFPEGTGQPLRWDTSGDPAANADLGFFDALLEEIGDTACIDTSRIYATGLSNGAMFTSFLVCERSEVLAAAAPVAGVTDMDPCPTTQPVPLLAIHGTADPILLFNGGVDVGALKGIGKPATDQQAGAEQTTSTTPEADLDGEGYPAAVRAFAERNGCDPEPSDSELSDEVIRRTYECPPGAEVEFLVVEGGGHSWPSSEFSRSIESIVGYTTFDIDATGDAWEFMSRFTRN